MPYIPRNPIAKNHMYLDLLSARQEALSSNLANMDTPNYVRKDIEFSQYLNAGGSLLETKLSQKLGPSGVIAARQEQLSAVDELVLMQQNSILYSVAAKNMSSTITMMKNAINVGQG